MTVSNVLVAVLGHVLVSFLSKYRSMEDFNAVRGTEGAMVGDYSFLTIPDIITNNGWQMRVIIGGRRLDCWSCRQQEHLAKHCP